MLQYLLKQLIVVTNNKPSLKQGFLVLITILLIIPFLLFLELIHYKCLWHELLHIYCPGCGGTRMIMSILHLDFYQAFRYNPLLFILLILGLLYLIIMLIIYKKKKVIILPSAKLWIIIVSILLIYFIIRNIPGFEYLIPTKV
jgi:hypothetical protein